MNKHVLQVPRGIRYISQWLEYKLPRGHIIVDKGVTGCGYTEYCLTNSENIILCSPRKLLLENKRDQHKKDLNILYFENGIEDFQGVKDTEDVIRIHMFRCREENEAIKFMVTYDSLHYLVEFLEKEGILEKFHFVVDEFQSIFLDSYFKSSVELDFVKTLQKCSNVLYLSATPMLEKYLNKLPEFCNLSYQILDWNDTGYVEKAVIFRKRTNSLAYECGKVIDSYLSGNFKITLNKNGKPVESKEAIFYLNSISEILRIVKSKKLTPDNTRIICSNTKENQDKLKKLGFQVGKVPLKDEENPMFMFCTSTVYVGVDFYSDNARTFVFSDPNITSLGTDISMDLPQIAGRVRNIENPFKNELTIFYKTQKNIITREDFDRLQEERREKTNDILYGFLNLPEKSKKAYLDKLKNDIKFSNYSEDFVAVSEETNLPVYNYLVEISNDRAWEVAQKDYQDNISVTRALENQGFEVEGYQTSDDLILQDFLDNYFFQTGFFHEKMRLYCEFRDTYSGNEIIMRGLSAKIIDTRFKMYYEYYGSRRCKALKYRESDLYKGWKDDTKGDDLETIIYSHFKEGKKYPMSEIKEILSGIYKFLNLSKIAKATDLKNYFKLSRTTVTLPDKTSVSGYKLEAL